MKIRPITPREAKAVWDSLEHPSTRSVAKAIEPSGPSGSSQHDRPLVGSGLAPGGIR